MLLAPLLAARRPLESGELEGIVRRVRYNCAMSLDGYIADADDGFDWIDIDPEIDFVDLSAQFDTYLIGRRTFEVVGQPRLPGAAKAQFYVFSQSLRQRDHGNVCIVGEDWANRVRSLRRMEGKDIWLFGGGELFGSLCNEGLVDTVEVAVMPIILGRGVPLVSGLSRHVKLILMDQRVYQKTGTVVLKYEVVLGPGCREGQ